MKYKIYTDGRDFYVKIKRGWVYKTVTTITGCVGYSWCVDLMFQTEKAAEAYVTRHYGIECERVRERRIV
jgi:hypothetical protein